MQNPYPPTRVLISEQLPLNYKISDTDKYKKLFTKAEEDSIINKYKHANLFDGCCIRMDSIKNNTVEMSPIGFYQFMCVNIVGISKRDPIAYDRVKVAIDDIGGINTFDKMISANFMPNIIGVSTLLHDVNYDYLLVERNTNLSVGSGVLACTSSGSVDMSDLDSPNPVIGCGIRELKEELDIEAKLSIEGLIAPVQKLHPIVLLTGKIDCAWSFLINKMKKAEDFNKENSHLIICPKDDLLPLISLYKFTDVASFQIFFESKGDRKKWKEAEYKPVKLSKMYQF